MTPRTTDLIASNLAPLRPHVRALKLPNDASLECLVVTQWGLAYGGSPVLVTPRSSPASLSQPPRNQRAKTIECLRPVVRVLACAWVPITLALRAVGGLMMRLSLLSDVFVYVYILTHNYLLSLAGRHLSPPAMLRYTPKLATRWLQFSTSQSRSMHADILEMHAPLALEPTRSTTSADASHQYNCSRSKISALWTWPRRLVARILGSQFLGWRFGALSFATWTTVVFLINLIFTIWTASAKREEQGVLLSGD